MSGVIAPMGDRSRPDEPAARPDETSVKPTADNKMDQGSPEIYSSRVENRGQAETQPQIVYEPGDRDTEKGEKGEQVEPERAVRTFERSAARSSSNSARDAYASGSGSGGSGYTPSARLGFGGGLNQAPAGVPAVPASLPGASANPPQAGPALALPLAGPLPTPPLSPRVGSPLPGPATLPPQAGPPPAVPIPTPDQIITAALDPPGGGPLEKKADGVLKPGHSPGAAYESDLTAYTAIEIEIAGPTDGEFDVVNITGAIASFPVGFKISFVLLGDYVPASGADFEFLVADALEGEENILYSFLKPVSTTLPNGFGYQVYADGDSDLHVRFYDASSPPQSHAHDPYSRPVSVPEPSTNALGLLGLALLGWRSQRVRSFLGAAP